MRSPIPRLPNYDIPPHRKALYYAGMAVAVAGFLLFLSNFVIMPMNMGRLDPGDGPSLMTGFAGRAVGGILLLIAGTALMNVGARGLAGSGVVLDPRQARQDVEPWSRLTGGVANDALEEVDVVQRLAGPRPESAPHVKVRCRHCQALNDEHDKFCGQCGQAL